MEKLDKEVAERHAQELADLQKRQSLAGASPAPPAYVMQLADSLYDTKLSAGADKVPLLVVFPSHPYLIMPDLYMVLCRPSQCHLLFVHVKPGPPGPRALSAWRRFQGA